MEQVTQFSRIEFHDEGPDEQGRRHYSLYWTDYRDREIVGSDGRVWPAGPFERGQNFIGVPPATLAQVQS